MQHCCKDKFCCVVHFVLLLMKQTAMILIKNSIRKAKNGKTIALCAKESNGIRLYGLAELMVNYKLGRYIETWGFGKCDMNKDEAIMAINGKLPFYKYFANI